MSLSGLFLHKEKWVWFREVIPVIKLCYFFFRISIKPDESGSPTLREKLKDKYFKSASGTSKNSPLHQTPQSLLHEGSLPIPTK